MKKQFIFSLLLAMTGVMFAGCEKTPDNGALQINADALETFAWKGGEQTFSFSSSYSWSATSSNEDWCTISPQSGPGGDHEIRVTVEEGSDSPRKATITISSNGQKKTIEVSQRGVIATVEIRATPEKGFWMGTNTTDPAGHNYYAGGFSFERPVHQVKLSAFRMGITEVTNAQYASFLNAAGIAYSEEVDYFGTSYKGCKGSVTVDGVTATHPLLYDGTTIFDGAYPTPWGITYATGQWVPMTGYENHPVIIVTWYGAKAFCDWLSGETGQTWRLPTEAEWEYACRAGEEGPWSFGSIEDDLGDYAWFSANSAGNSAMKTHAVRQKKANGYGLYDMHGNVWEWCSDWFDGGYYSVTLDGGWNNPTGPATGTFRVTRGGSWDIPATVCRSAYRSSDPPAAATSRLGFRVVLELP